MPTYKTFNGTSYNTQTPDKICEILESLRQKRSLVRLYYGDVHTGKDWHEENDTVGKIGRSAGQVKVPLLIPINDVGGPQLLDHCLVKIVELNPDYTTKKVHYQHPDFNQSKFEVLTYDKPITVNKSKYQYAVLKDGEPYAFFDRLDKAVILCGFLRDEHNLSTEVYLAALKALGTKHGK